MIFQKVGNNTSLQNMGSFFVADIGQVELGTWNLHSSSEIPRSEPQLRFYYIHTATQETTWTLPSRVSVSIPKAEWERCESSKYPGKFYLKNSQTGETKWA